MRRAQFTQQVIFHDGLERSYLLYIPASYDPARPCPLLLVLHGGGGDSEGMIKLTGGGFNQLTDQEGWIVVYPDGIRRQWNDGRPMRGRHSEADDVGFIRTLIAYLASEFAIDPRRVYSTGISNGGHMSYRLACDLSEQIAGIAAVAALMPQMPGEVCAPSRPVAVLIIAGTDDPLIPYNGGEIRVLGLRRGNVLSADETARLWAEINHCVRPPTVRAFPDHDPHDGTQIRQTVYSGGDAPVVLYTVEGGGHTWPGGLQYLGERMIGKTSREFDACQVIWEFFRGLTRREH